jgi:hypothetical protein
MGERDVLTAEVGAALGILGLLLVFLPLFLQSLEATYEGRATARERRARAWRAWSVPALIAIAATDATLGVLTLWGTVCAARATGYMLLGLIWLVVAVAATAVWKA